MEGILRSDGLEVEDRSMVRRALDLFGSSRGDFADYLIGESNVSEGCEKTVTFDADLKGAPGFDVL